MANWQFRKKHTKKKKKEKADPCPRCIPLFTFDFCSVSRSLSSFFADCPPTLQPLIGVATRPLEIPSPPPPPPPPLPPLPRGTLAKKRGKKEKRATRRAPSSSAASFSSLTGRDKLLWGRRLRTQQQQRRRRLKTRTHHPCGRKRAQRRAQQQRRRQSQAGARTRQQLQPASLALPNNPSISLERRWRVGVGRVQVGVGGCRREESRVGGCRSAGLREREKGERERERRRGCAQFSFLSPGLFLFSLFSLVFPALFLFFSSFSSSSSFFCCPPLLPLLRSLFFSLANAASELREEERDGGSGVRQRQSGSRA